ncbi:MAG: GIY-YIG nuclease family protein [Leptolyngbya sp. SIO4C1]|nr:GIY-YIG nuclease family protein [Leptolyngbya sp. SIO4C1]
MTVETSVPTLASLEAIPYLTEAGQIPEAFEGKVGIYAIYDRQQQLQYVGFSRDVAVGLKQHLVRRPNACYWVKMQAVERPSRTLLEGIRNAWIAENGTVPPGNAADQDAWEKPIDAKQQMTDDERAAIAKADGVQEIKLLKNVARRVQAEVLEALKARGAEMDLRFNPKLKESGLLDLK